MINRTSVKTQLYDEIRRKIIFGGYEMNSPVSIFSLTEEYGVSNTPVREALAMLESDGLLIKDGAKYRVVALTEQNNADLDEASKHIIVSSYEICVAHNYIDELVSVLHDRYDRQVAFSTCDDPVEYLKATIDFDTAFPEVCKNPYMIAAFMKTRAFFTLAIVHKHNKNFKANLQEHLDILQAIEKRDVKEAKRLIRHHYEKPLSKFPVVD